MKERLDQFTIAQLLDIACGDRSSIGADDDKTAEKVALSLIAEYNNISDPIAAKASLIDNEHNIKLSAKFVLAKICSNLIRVYGAYDDVKSILAHIGYSVSSYDNEALRMKVEQMVRSNEAELKRIKLERQKEMKCVDLTNNLRQSYDTQTASLMAHFKMPIDHNTISASIYANLVNMACRAQRSQMSKK